MENSEIPHIYSGRLDECWFVSQEVPKKFIILATGRDY
jgi:hypothetical protein